MKKLSVQLNQDYKSFNTGFSCELHGHLIILSGVNGSGKSQLIDIITQRESRGNSKAILATIKLDDTVITRDDILRRTFKENISAPDLTRAGTEIVKSHKGQVWNAYNKHRLNHQTEELWDYKESCKEAKRILIEEFGESDFNSGKITQIELQDRLPNSFVWRSDDVFTNVVGELFFNYAVDVLHAKAKASENGRKFDESSLTKAPWLQLNELFANLGLEYRFKDNYFIKDGGLEINEQPGLYHIGHDGLIDPNEARKLADLSDGEKSIIALSFASLSGVKHEDKKVLLLDEFDANFNPSLTEIFYKILDQYFISKEILIIIATHSPTTISLAPDSASFYEVFKANATSSDRILSVQKDDYAELEIANRSFYTKVSNQASRISELELEKKDLEERINESRDQVKPFLFVEGDIDIQYLEKATELYPEWKATLDRIKMEEKNGKGGLKKYWKYRSQIKEFLKHPVILLFDCDTNESDEDDPFIYKRCMPIEISHSIKTGIENLLPDALIDKAQAAENKVFVKKSIPDAHNVAVQVWEVVDNEKKNLADWVCANATKEDFSGFSVVFCLIQGIIDSRSTT